MSVWGHRGSYRATVFVVTFFVFLSTVAYLAAPFIEQEENVVLKNSDSDFMRMARFQSVEWREWGSDALAEAKRKDRPVLVIAGMPWAEMRRKFDGLFAAEEVSEFLNQEFVCIRVDTLADPSWRVSPAPISRSLIGDSTDFFFGVFTADGEVLSIPSLSELNQMSDVVFLTYMSERLQEFAARKMTSIHEQALAEVDQLRGGVASAGTDALEYIAATESRIGVGGRILPYEMELLLDEGRIEPVSRTVDRMLTSTSTDLLWGGFFETRDARTGEVQFVKSAFSNAAMLRVLSRLAVATGEARYARAARWQYNFVKERYAKETSSASDYAKLGDASRSGYYSFPRTRLNKIFRGDEFKLVEEELGLVPKNNPQMIPYTVDLDEWSDGTDDVENLLEKLRNDVAEPERMQGQLVSYEAQAESVRSLIYSSRLLGDGELLSVALVDFRELRERMRIGVDDVLASPGLQPTSEVGLGTYLAYASAAWEALLAGGDFEIGWDGAQVLDRALFLYRDDRSSLWSASISDFDSDWRKVIPPPVFDGSIRSGAGELIRLSNLYGSWRGSKSHRVNFLRARDRAVSQTSWVLSETPVNLGTLARAVRQSTRGVAVGFEGSVDWTYWEQNFPGLPLVPVVEQGVRGYRLLNRGEWSGPYELDELAGLLR